MNFFIQDEYKFINPEDTPYGGFPIYMAKFLEDYREGRSINAGKNNHTDRCTKNFINAIKLIRREEISN